MLRPHLLPLIFAILVCSCLAAQDDEKLVSGPKAGTFMPAPFECLNLNGPSKGRPNCLICRFGLSPSLIVFTKEPEEGKGAPLSELAKQLEELAEEFQDRDFSVGIIFLSNDARDSTNNAGLAEAKDIIDEAIGREKLVKRLEDWLDAAKLKRVTVACLPEAPKKYKLHEKAETTILFYERLKVIENYAYPPEGMQAKDVDVMVKRLRDTLPAKKKPGEEKQPKG